MSQLLLTVLPLLLQFRIFNQLAILTANSSASFSNQQLGFTYLLMKFLKGGT